jgi:hypothetical protein
VSMQEILALHIEQQGLGWFIRVAPEERTDSGGDTHLYYHGTATQAHHPLAVIEHHTGGHPSRLRLTDGTILDPAPGEYACWLIALGRFLEDSYRDYERGGTP